MSAGEDRRKRGEGEGGGKESQQMRAEAGARVGGAEAAQLCGASSQPSWGGA